MSLVFFSSRQGYDMVVSLIRLRIMLFFTTDKQNLIESNVSMNITIVIVCE